MAIAFAQLLATLCFWGATAQAKEHQISSAIKFSPGGTSPIRKLGQAFSQAGEGSISPKQKNTIEQINEATEFAASVTGVRKDFLMGMLVVESNLGRNVGQCSFDEIEREVARSYQNGRIAVATWNTFQKRKVKLAGILKKLGRDPKTTLVSCNPASYQGTGGAMGVAQFMPDTWLEYEKRISRVVGKEIPDPWNIRDGVVAMALKLSDVQGVKSHYAWAEANAAKLYLSGTTSARFNWYARKILFWSKNYRKLIA